MEAPAFRRPPGRPRRENVTAPLSALKPPAQLPVFDAIIDQPISRFTLFDMQEWGPWLLSRLEHQWPGKNAAYWQGKINNINASNDFLFIKNEEAVLLAVTLPHLMDDRLRGAEILAWSKRAEPLNEDNPNRLILNKRSEGVHHLAALYLYAREWMRKRGALWLMTGVCTDMPVEYLESLLKGQCADWVVVT